MCSTLLFYYFVSNARYAATQWVKVFLQMEILNNNYVIAIVPGMEPAAL
jgi:hypothetical protein